ncbi:MAG: undecaprenyl/decaprenyl-phosphate alpha-N-acetylglucosaminyl 1-phosphate transferase [Natronohydrobacter sp.]|nr:undecaprenyl/decaprenyl-phosphate alpha-N-acetylglucosaminyl 1-phosphate transferase [Natronohydrobacter sp.]
MNISFFSLIAITLISGSICALTVWKFQLLQGTLYKRSGDSEAVQASHVAPAPRLAGVAFLAALLAAHALIFDAYQHLFVSLSLAVFPVFLAGLLEDFGYPLRPRSRLLATIVSSALMIWITGYWVSSIGVAAFDTVLRFAIVGMFITVLVASSVTQAFNLIDGLNGFAGSVAFCTALGLFFIASAANEPVLAAISLTTCAALLGFLILNYPSGRIFLGDAGAYTVGFILAWIAILLVARTDQAIAFALFLVFFWPLADLHLAVYRRWRRNRPISHPDRLHFHQLVMRALELALFSRARRRLSNPIATAVMMPFVIVPIITGVLLWDKPALSALALFGFSVLFVGTYMLGISLASRRFFSNAAIVNALRLRLFPTETQDDAKLTPGRVS